MTRTSDIRKLSDFLANVTAHLDRLAETGAIEVLTVNGEAKGVVMGTPKGSGVFAQKKAPLKARFSIQEPISDNE